MAAPEAHSVFDLNLHHRYLHYRRTKIVATIGPASDSPEKLAALIRSGLDVARINFSHGDPADHVKTIALIRRVAKRAGKSVAVLGDLCGPKVRVGSFKGGSALLKENSLVRITVKPVTGDGSLFQSQYTRLVKDVRVGEPILLDDGNLELRVTKRLLDAVEARVIRGGLLKDHKGMNMPESKLTVPALTEKDKRDVETCLKADVDFLALSFVKKASDVKELKRILERARSDIQIIAKIEMPEALSNIEAILDHADGIMVARGDLGVELPAKKVPMIQNQLVRLASRYDKPVIVATQMLESMIDHGRPTRAEVTDVASACLSGADAVMLSAETASGKYPLEALSTMDEILRETEAYQFFAMGGRFGQPTADRKDPVHEALSTATAQISRDLMVHSVFALTHTGYTARMVSAQRPSAPILAATQNERVARQMNLLWGVVPFLVKKRLSLPEYIRWAEGTVQKLKLAKRGDYLILLSGSGGKKIATDNIHIHPVG
jgi:pyruvate kinase